jgi:hypothetical protein
MSESDQRPDVIWSRKFQTAGVRKYFSIYRGEFTTDWINSNYPYKGKASSAFRLVTKMESWEAEERFEGGGNGCWALKRDGPLNDLTADLLAAADALGAKLQTKSSSGFPGGIGAESGTVWAALLDGGVGVTVNLWEHQTTNRVHASQRTTIRGPSAYRALLELLGFDWISRKLAGESQKPSHEDYLQIVNNLLTQQTPSAI